MALFGLLGGGQEEDPYADILTPAQRNQMQSQGLLAMAAAFAEAGMPSRLPIPFGAALGKAAGALGAGQEAGMTAALANAARAQQIRDLRSKGEFRSKFFGDQNTLNDLIKSVLGGGSAMPTAPRPAGAPPPAGTYVPPGAADAPLNTMELPYPEAPGGGLLGGDVGSAGEYGTGGATGLLGAVPPVVRAAAARAAPGGQIPGYPSIRPNAAGQADRAYIDANPLAASGGGLLGPGVGGGSAPADLGAGGDEPASGYPALAETPWGPTWPQGGAVGAPSRGGGISDPRGKIPVIQAAAARYGRDPDIALKVARSEGLATFLGDGGKSGGAFQLYTGGGLGNEFQKETGLNPLDPNNEDATIDWAMKNLDRTGWSPYHGARLVGVGPRTGISGGGTMMAAASTTEGSGGGEAPQGWGPTWPGGAGGPSLAPAAPAGGATAPGMPAVPVPPGVDPAKMNALLLELARRNAGAEVLGMGNPYGSLLSVLQGSPQYKAMIEQATRGAGLPFVRPEAEEKAAGEYPFLVSRDAYKAQLDQVNKKVEQMGAAALDPAPILVSDGKGGTVERQGTRYQAMLAANGFSVPELGIKGIYPPPPPGEMPNIPGLTPPGASQGRPAPAPQAQAEPGGFPAAGTPAGKPVAGPLDAADIKIFQEKRATADTARTTIENANDMRAAIERGVIAGSGANARTELLKLGQLLKLTGPNEDALIRNTEAYIAQAGKNLKEGLAGLGPPISKSDTDIAERIAGGQMNTTQGMLEILRIREKYHRQAIIDYNRMAAGQPPSRIIGDRTVKEPPTYGAAIIEGPNGRRMWNNNGKWQEF